MLFSPITVYPISRVDSISFVMHDTVLSASQEQPVLDGPKVLICVGSDTEKYQIQRVLNPLANSTYAVLVQSVTCRASLLV